VANQGRAPLGLTPWSNRHERIRLFVVRTRRQNSRVKKKEAASGARLPAGKVGALGPIEKLRHDLNAEYVTPDAFLQAQKFVAGCLAIAESKLKKGEQSGHASTYLAELAAQLAEAMVALTQAGDIMLARRLPSIVARMQAAEAVFGDKLTPVIVKRRSIDQLLEQRRPRELINAVAALYPDWARVCGIPDPKAFLARPEHELRELLLANRSTERGRHGTDAGEWQHPLAQMIERFWAVREMHQPNVNCFVEHLLRGRLWSGPNGTYEAVKWPRRPDRQNVAAWMGLIMPYLKQVTDGDATKLGVFRDMIAARNHCFDGERTSDARTRGTRLAEASASDIWNQVGAEIRKALQRMAKQARKPLSRKPA
jgi:hypothetical protein